MFIYKGNNKKKLQLRCVTHSLLDFYAETTKRNYNYINNIWKLKRKNETTKRNYNNNINSHFISHFSYKYHFFIRNNKKKLQLTSSGFTALLDVFFHWLFFVSNLKVSEAILFMFEYDKLAGLSYSSMTTLEELD